MIDRKLLALVCAVLAATLIAACGGDDSDSKQQFGATVGSGPSTLTKEQFVQRANQICDEGNKELDAATQALGKSPSAAQVSSFATDTLVPSVEQQISDIRALGAPQGDEDQVNAILDAAQADAEKVKTDPSLLAGGADPFADANKLADEYGLTSCGSGGDESGGAPPTATDTGASGGTGGAETGGSGSTGGSGGGAAPTDSDGNGIPDPSN